MNAALPLREAVRFTKIYKRTFLTTILCIRVVNRTKLNLDPPLQVENKVKLSHNWSDKWDGGDMGKQAE